MITKISKYREKVEKGTVNPAKFRKRALVVDAWPIYDLLEMHDKGPHALPAEIRKAIFSKEIEVLSVCRGIAIKTMEGTMVGSPESWLIRGIHGEFYPIDNLIFETTYQKLEPYTHDRELPDLLKEVQLRGNTPPHLSNVLDRARYRLEYLEALMELLLPLPNRWERGSYNESSELREILGLSTEDTA